MRKKLLALTLAVCTAFSLAACSSGNEDETTTASQVDKTGNGYVLDKEGQVELGIYKGITIYEDDVKITDEDLEKYVDSRLSYDSKTVYVEEGTVAENSQIKISYKGTIDGKEFSGGSSEGKIITITDAAFEVEGFTKGLIGHSCGETVELDLVMPKEYENKELAGKPVHYSVKIMSFVKKEYPELTDEYVEKNYGDIGLKTVGQFYDYLKDDMYTSNVMASIWQTIVDGSTVISFDEEEYKKLYKECEAYNESQIQSYYGVSAAEYRQGMGISDETWEKQIATTVEDMMREDLIINAIAKEENITLSDEEYQKKLLEYTKFYGYKTVDELKESYGEGADEYFKQGSIKILVWNYLTTTVEKKPGSNPDKETTKVSETESAKTEAETTTVAE